MLYQLYFLKHVRRLPDAVGECKAPLVHVEEHIRQTNHVVSTALDHQIHGIFAAKSEIASKGQLLSGLIFNMIALGIQIISD